MFEFAVIAKFSLGCVRAEQCISDEWTRQTEWREKGNVWFSQIYITDRPDKISSRNWRHIWYLKRTEWWATIVIHEIRYWPCQIFLQKTWFRWIKFHLKVKYPIDTWTENSKRTMLIINYFHFDVSTINTIIIRWHHVFQLFFTHFSNKISCRSDHWVLQARTHLESCEKHPALWSYQ